MADTPPNGVEKGVTGDDLIAKLTDAVGKTGGADAVRMARELGEIKARMEAMQGELEAAKKQNSDLSRYAAATRKLLRGDVAPDEQKAAARELLKLEGLSEDEVEKYIEAMGEGDGDTGGGSKKPAPDEGGGVDRIALVEQELAKLRGDYLTKYHEERLRTMVAEDPAVRGLLEKAEAISGKGFVDKARERLVAESALRSKWALYNRATRSGKPLDRAAIDEELGKSVKDVAGLIPSMLGELSSLGKTPDAGTSDASIVSKQPPPTPEWKPGKDRGTVTTELDAWMKDGLIRDALESAKAGGNKA